MQHELHPNDVRPLRSLLDLTGRVGVVTGGSRGLGLQVAEVLAEYGATTVLIARSRGELDAAVARLAGKGWPSDGIDCNLAQCEDLEPIVRAILARQGRIDILINGAGTTWGAPAEDYPDEAWNKVFALNVTAAFRLTQAVAKAAMIPARSGKVVNIASIAGLKGNAPGQVGTVAYNASKAAVINMTRALAAEWGGYCINVNAIAPGYFKTRMTAKVVASLEEEATARIPMSRLGSDVDLKGAALLLASDAGAYITGQTLVVDGGLTIT